MDRLIDLFADGGVHGFAFEVVIKMRLRAYVEGRSFFFFEEEDDDDEGKDRWYVLRS